MKSNVNPAIIALSVVVLLVVVFLIYHFTMGGSQPTISADNAPPFVKQMQKGQAPTSSPYH